jgi:hypothetical protein
MALTLTNQADEAQPEVVKRAVLYLRVSSRGQLETDTTTMVSRSPPSMSAAHRRQPNTTPLS